MDKLKMAGGLAAIAAILVTANAYAAGGGAELEKANIDPGNISSLQRGARNFMNYCSGCHSAQVSFLPGSMLCLHRCRLHARSEHSDQARADYLRLNGLRS